MLKCKYCTAATVVEVTAAQDKFCLFLKGSKWQEVLSHISSFYPGTKNVTIIFCKSDIYYKKQLHRRTSENNRKLSAQMSKICLVRLTKKKLLSQRDSVKEEVCLHSCLYNTARNQEATARLFFTAFHQAHMHTAFFSSCKHA